MINAFYQNVRGLKSKLSTWRNNLTVLEHHLVAASETFLNGSVEDSELICSDWSIVRRDRATPCGGVLLAARAPIVLLRRRDLETDSGEDLWASFKWRGLSLYVCVVYIKPSANDSEYMEWFTKVESFVNLLKGSVLILGDINMNSASVNILNYYSYFLSFCCLTDKNVVTNSHGGMLDVVLVQESEGTREVYVSATEGLVPPDTYHPPLDIEVGTDTAHYSDTIYPSNIDPARDWNFGKCDYELLFSLLSQQQWCDVLDASDVDSASQNFYDVIYNMFNQCMPKKRRMNAQGRRFPVWFTRDIIQDTRRKVKLHRDWKRLKTGDSYRLFSDLRSDLKSRVTLAYNSYMQRIESNLKVDPRKFWQHITSLRLKGGFEPNVSYKGTKFSGAEAAEAFADFFSSIFLPDIPLLNTETLHKGSGNSNYVNIGAITCDDVVAGINKLKLNSSIGPDNIPPLIVKSAKKLLCEPLCAIFNLALKSGVYPSHWKLSRVTPIPKSLNKTMVEEYRPIAILSSPAKIFESIVHKHIYAQVKAYLCNEQHGFRAKRSVDTNLLTLVDFISTKLDRKSQVDVLYFDFRKAFDRVNNDTLLAKLSDIGFAPNLLRLLADYLRDRQQFVRLGLYESRPYHTRSGVSQGSILGPLLFLLMVNDLPSVLNHARSLLYADDLKLYMEIKSEDDCRALQRDVDAIFEWSVKNRMEFNSSKCYAMTFGRMRRPICFEYKLNNFTIEKTTVMKDLGVTFDHKLTFHGHMMLLAKESFRRLGFVLRNVRDFKNTKVIKLLYGALVRSKLETSACIWNPYESTYSLLLEKVQKAFLRYLYKRLYGYYPFMYPTMFLLGTLGYNSLEVRRANDQVKVACKILHDKIDAPDLHNELSRFFTPNNYLRARRHALFAVPLCRTVARAKSPIPRTLAALNALLDSNPDCDLFADEWMKLLFK